MTVIPSLILTLAIVGGQLVKIPIAGGGATLLDITIIIFCLVGLAKIRLKLLNPPLAIKTGLLFSLIALLSLILTPLKLTLLQYLSSALYIVRFFSIIFLGWLFFSKSLPEVKKNINKILLLSGVAIAILGFFQLLLIPDLYFISFFGWDPHYFRTVSTFLDPNFAGAFLVLTLILLFQNLGKSKKWFLYFLLVYLALLTTFSRSSYLAFLISFLTLALFNKSFKMAIFTVILFLGLLGGFSAYHQKVAEPRGINRALSAQARFNTWQQGIILFQTHPFLGVGFNTYRYGVEQYNIGNQEFLSSRGSSTNDSSLLHAAATTGIVGLISFLLFLFLLIKANTYNPALIAGLFGLVIQSFFVNLLFYPFILLWLILMSSKQSAKLKSDD